MSERFASEVDVKLTQQINDATAAAERTQVNLDERYVSIGRLLIEVKKLYPKRADFEDFLRQTNLGVLRSRAYDLMTMVDPKEAQRLLQQNRDRVAKHREKKRRQPVNNPPNPPHGNHIDAAASADLRKVENAKADGDPHTALPGDSAEAIPKLKRMRQAKNSTRCLNEFRFACDNYLPHMSYADLQVARSHFDRWVSNSKKEAA
jgi:hypothetical protein